MAPGARALLLLSVRNLRRSGSLALFLALLVPSASLAVPLMMGHSFQEGLRGDIYRSLGEVDEVVRSREVLGPRVLEVMRADGRLGELTDALAPAIVLRASVSLGDRSDPNVDILGIDGTFGSLGAFTDRRGGRLSPEVGPGRIYIGEDCARRLGASEGSRVLVRFQEPGFSIESIYSNLSGSRSAGAEVSAVLAGEGLGALRLAPRGEPRRTAFANLSWLSGELERPGINAILVSNEGDARSGAGLTGRAVARLGELLDREVGIVEGGYAVGTGRGYAKLESRNIFFAGAVADLASASDIRVRASSRLTSYFVNKIEGNGSWIAYSVVTALDPSEDGPFGKFIDNATGLETLGPSNESDIVLTDYTASRLGLGVGDPVKLNFTRYDRNFCQTVAEETFRVSQVVDLVGKADDPDLMPPFPGIKGRASCGDWTPPIGIDFSIMVPEDLAYWQSHGGTPKAYINARAGQRLFDTDLGNLTTVKLLPAPGTSPEELALGVSAGLNASLSPAELGVTVDPVKKDALDSVSGLDIVTEALLAFGSAVTASGMVLIVVVVQTSVEARRRELGILRSLGVRRRALAVMVALEGGLLSLGASAAGLLAGAGLAALGLGAASAAFRGVLPAGAGFAPLPLEQAAAVYLASLLLCVVSFLAGALSASRGSVVSNLRELREAAPAPGRRRNVWDVLLAAAFLVPFYMYWFAPLPRHVLDLLVLVGGGCLLILLLRRTSDLSSGAKRLAVYAFVLGAQFLLGLSLGGSPGENALLFHFVVGDLLLLELVLILRAELGGLASALSRRARAGRLSLLNPARSPGRTTAFVLVYALVVFPLLALFSYVPLQASQLSAQAELRGGGYDILGVTQAPLYFDLSDPSERGLRNITGFPDLLEVLPLLTFGDVGGTCSNLNSVAPPRLIGASPAFMNGSRIPVVQSEDGSEGRQAWKLLDRHRGAQLPAIADYTTAVWMLERGLGGSLRVVDEQGRPAELRIVAILHDCIFQGSVFVSESDLGALYPTLARQDHFLFRVEEGQSARRAAEDLESSLSAFGMSARPVEDIVAELVRVDLTYVSMLQATLIAGVALGSVGFWGKVAREALERRRELGVMRAVGFKRGAVLGLFLGENLFIFLLGFACGWAASTASALAFLGMAPPPLETLALLGLLAGIICLSTAAPLARALGRSPSENLRTLD